MITDENSVKDRRTVFYCPVIHTAEDLGSMARPVQMLTIQAIGKDGQAEKEALINQFWTLMETFIESLDLSIASFRLYQDGLPVCGKEHDIVTSMAQNGSRNHKILCSLIDQGATLMGTEDAALLLEEYHLVTQAMNPEKDRPFQPEEVAQKQAVLLQKRDQYIAKRINHTLLAGETGILFIGLLHGLEKWLDPDIRVIHAEKHF